MKLFSSRIAIGVAWLFLATAQAAFAQLQVQPPSVSLLGKRSSQSLLVCAVAADGRTQDLTPSASFKSLNEKIARVDAFGRVYAVGTGATKIEVKAGGKTSTVAVAVNLPDQDPISFRHEVMPILSKAGCNSGACHGYSLGKNGFKLSLRGGDEDADYLAITQEYLGRRINIQQPDLSLLLRKPLGDLPHRGGVKLEQGEAMHLALRDWIAAGAPSDRAQKLALTGVQVYPQKAILRPGERQQFQLMATYSDGSMRDVTRLAVFSSNSEKVAIVDDFALATAKGQGETAIIARYERLFSVAEVLALGETKAASSKEPAPTNLVDRHVKAKLDDLKIEPSALCDDAEYLRRVYIDLICLQPRPDELRAFLADRAPDKREKVVEALLKRPEFVDHWALKWGDLLQNSRARLSEPAMKAFHGWIRKAVADNLPLDAMVRELLTSEGDYRTSPASAYFLISENTEVTVERATQTFCGVRMLCAKCHNHPFENWNQADYFGLLSFFNQVAVKQITTETKDKKAVKERAIEVKLKTPFALNPRVNAKQAPRFLGGDEPKLEGELDRRKAYADWLTSRENPHFARSMVNRFWSYFFARGIIDPVDDLRSTNPPSNGPLLEALTKDFVDHKFDLRHLMRTIVTSRTYQRSSTPTASNAHDEVNFSRCVPRRLRAEALLDCLVQATGVSEKFAGYPDGTRAAQLSDPFKADGKAAGATNATFLALFGQPQRLEACECERSDESNMLQALECINGKAILDRVAAPKGRLAAELLPKKKTDRELVDELYLWSLCRLPTEREAELSLAHMQRYEGRRAEAAQDLFWALLNSKDFQFNH